MIHIDKDPPDNQRKQVMFFGRIMANVSHEFNNVITVINELSGLLKDLTSMARNGREIPSEKIASISDSISRQVARGKHLITHMNRFSHSVDEPVAEVDLHQTVQNMQELTDRLFKCRESKVHFQDPGKECSLHTDPFELRHVIFSCLDRYLQASSPEVSLQLHRPEGSDEIELRMSGRVPGIGNDLSAPPADLEKRAAALGGRLAWEKNNDAIFIRLTFPKAMPDRGTSPPKKEYS
jgi:C4-dicarboxylate-specific signal transduction histidine kinase